MQLIVRTGRALDPYTRDYGTHDRGLLSTRSLVSLGSGLHFGIFTDGWYIISSDGSWTELGTQQAQNGSTYYKWKRTFYETLNYQAKSQISVEYDPINHTVLVSWPSSGSSVPNNLWRYDVSSDRCFPRTETFYPNVLGRYIEDASTGLTWAAATPSWADTTSSWGSEAGTRGADRIVMGTPGGLVFQFQGAQISKQRDGVDPSWFYSSHFFDGGKPEIHKRNDRLYVTYKHLLLGGSTAPVSAAVMSNNGTTASGAIATDQGAPGSRQTDFVSGTASGQQFQFQLSGSGDTQIQRVGFEFSIEDAKVLRREVSG
jgi:hypothetical protein